MFGLFAPAPEVGADYSYEAAFNQRRKGNTYKLSADEWLVEVNKINGSRMYSYLTTLEEIEKGRPLTKKERGDTLFSGMPKRRITKVVRQTCSGDDISKILVLNTRGSKYFIFGQHDFTYFFCQ